MKVKKESDGSDIQAVAITSKTDTANTAATASVTKNTASNVNTIANINTTANEEYFRALLHGVETCVKDALQRSNGKNGKCNIVIDASGVGFSYIPPINITKKILPIFDQLFSGRFGNLVVVNMAMAAQIFFKVVMPFLPDNVQSKIYILPKNSEEASNMLKSLVEEEFIPTWLGGRDDYVFDADEYYNTGKYKSAFISDNEGVEYNKLMAN